MTGPPSHANVDASVQCMDKALKAALAGDCEKAQRLMGKASSMAPHASWDPEGKLVKRVAEVILAKQTEAAAREQRRREPPPTPGEGNSSGQGAGAGARASGGGEEKRKRGRWAPQQAKWWSGGKAHATLLGKAAGALLRMGWEKVRSPVTRGANMVAGKRARTTARAAARALAQTLLHLLAERTFLYGKVAVEPVPGNHSPAVQAVAKRCCDAVSYGAVGAVWGGGVVLAAGGAYFTVSLSLSLVWAVVGFAWWLGTLAGSVVWWLFCRFFWEPSWWASLIASVCIWNADPPSCAMWPYPLAWWWWQGGWWTVVGTVVSIFIEVNLITFSLHAIFAWTCIGWSVGFSAWWAKLICLVISGVLWVAAGAVFHSMAANAAGLGGQSPELGEEEVPPGAPEEVARMLRCTDHYSVMGLDRLCEVPADLKKTYHKKLLRVHPDKNGNAPGAAKAFQRLTDAYECLSDPRSLRDYNRVLGAKISDDEGAAGGTAAGGTRAQASAGGPEHRSEPPKGTAGRRRRR